MVDLSILKECLKKVMPDLSDHFEEVGFDPSSLCIKWFLCIFTQSFCPDMAIKILDLFLLDGSKSLYLIALSIFSENADKIMDTEDNCAILVILQE